MLHVIFEQACKFHLSAWLDIFIFSLLSFYFLPSSLPFSLPNVPVICWEVALGGGSKGKSLSPRAFKDYASSFRMLRFFFRAETTSMVLASKRALQWFVPPVMVVVARLICVHSGLPSVRPSIARGSSRIQSRLWSTTYGRRRRGRERESILRKS